MAASPLLRSKLPRTAHSRTFSALSSFFSSKSVPPSSKSTSHGGANKWWPRPPIEKKPLRLSPEAAALMRRLRTGGYLRDPVFGVSPDRILLGEEDENIFPAYCRPHFVKSAAERFGNDHQEIAKWLSGKDLKKVALVGCPSVERRTVFAAKRLRSFFRIQEDITCRACKMRSSCQFVNQSVGGQSKVILADVMRILALFALKAVPRRMLGSDDLRSSVSKLLKDIVNLTG